MLARNFRKGAFLTIILLLVGGILVGFPKRDGIAAAPSLVLPASISLTQVTSGLNLPTSITHAGDGSSRIFVTERGGLIRIIKNGALQATPFLDLSARVATAGPEQGLLDIAFPPNYASKGYFYVYYINKTGVGDTVVARFRLTANPDVADPNSEEIILTQTQPYANHNGGQLAFGRDGLLYIGLGDGGSGGDPQNNAQNPASLLGKILRIDVASIPNSVMPGASGVYTYFLPLATKTNASTASYSIPATNPFALTAGYRGEIWSLGLRNPWRFSFDRLTGDLYIGDVGQNVWEEINFQPGASNGGENYGWRCYEGNHAYNPSGCLPQNSYVAPITEYDHSQGCSITGGYVYRGAAFPAMQGVYFFADFCNGKIWGMQYNSGTSSWQKAQLGTAPTTVSTFGEDQAGELYVAGYGNGIIYKVVTP